MAGRGVLPLGSAFLFFRPLTRVGMLAAGDLYPEGSRKESALVMYLLICLLAPEVAWVDYQSPSKNYTASFPEKPTEQTKQSSGMTIEFVTADCDGLVFMIQEGKLPKAPASLDEERTMMNGIEDGWLKGSGAKLVSHRDFQISGAPARELVVSMQSGQVSKVWVVLANGIYYAAIVVFPDKEAISRPEAEKFLTSFKLANYTPTVYPAAESRDPAYLAGRAVGGLCGVGLLLVLGYVVIRFLVKLGTKKPSAG